MARSPRSDYPDSGAVDVKHTGVRVDVGEGECVYGIIRTVPSEVAARKINCRRTYRDLDPAMKRTVLAPHRKRCGPGSRRISGRTDVPIVCLGAPRPPRRSPAFASRSPKRERSPKRQKKKRSSSPKRKASPKGPSATSRSPRRSGKRAASTEVRIVDVVVEDDTKLVLSATYGGKAAILKVMSMHSTGQNPPREEFRMQNLAAKHGLAPRALYLCRWWAAHPSSPGATFACAPFTEDDEEDGRDSAMVMRRAAGVEIDSYLRANRSTADVEEVAAAVHDALSRLSRLAGLHHLDIFDPVTQAPHNVFLHRSRKDGPLSAKLIDFGMAREHGGRLSEEYDLEDLTDELQDFVDTME